MAVIEFTPQSTASATTLSTSKSCTAGSTVVVFGYVEQNAYSLTCDIGGSSAGTEIEFQQRSGEPKLYCWLKENVAGGSIVCEIDEAGANNATMHLYAYEITGAPASSALDAVDSYGDVATPNCYATAPGGITIASGSVAIAFYAFDRTTDLTLSGWTSATEATPRGYYPKPRYKTFSGGGSGERAAGTVDPNAWYDAILVAVKQEAPPVVLSGNADLDGISTSGGMSSAPTEISGNADLDGISTSGGMSSFPSEMTGNPTLDDVGTSGSLGVQPGVLTVPELRNWAGGGALLTSELIPNVVVLTMARPVTLLAVFEDVTTHATTADLEVASGVLVPGTACMVLGFNSNGTQRFARPATVA